MLTVKTKKAQICEACDTSLWGLAVRESTIAQDNKKPLVFRVVLVVVQKLQS